MKKRITLSDGEMGLHEIRMQVQSFEKYKQRQTKIDAAQRKRNPNKPLRVCSVCQKVECPWSED